jgi:hypothetical protein
MKKLKVAFFASAFLLTAAITYSSSASANEDALDCASAPNSSIANVDSGSCGAAGSVTCCYVLNSAQPFKTKRP